MKSQSNKLTGKDLINVGIYSAIYFVIVFLIAMLGVVPVLSGGQGGIHPRRA